MPALVAAARGGEVTALDWAAEAVALLRENAARNGLELEVVHADWRAFAGSYDLALGADLLYERRNGEALLALLPRLAPEVLLAEPGRPHAAEFLLRARGGLGGERARRPRLPAHPHRRARLTAAREATTMAACSVAFSPRSSPRSTTRAESTSTPSRRSPATSSTTAPTASSSPGRPARARRSSDGERLDLVAAALEAVGDRATVVAGTGTASTAHSCELTAAAHELGADAFLIVTPYYNKPPQRGIVAHFAAIAAETDRPLVVYNIPSRVVVNIEPETISRLAEIPNIRAVKQAHADLGAGTPRRRDRSRPLRRRRQPPRAVPRAGRRRRHLRPHPPRRPAGARPRCGPPVTATWRAPARSTPSCSRPTSCSRITTNPIPVKAALRLLGHEVGGFRLPLVPPSEEELARVRDCLARLGLLVAA